MVTSILLIKNVLVLHTLIKNFYRLLLWKLSSILISLIGFSSVHYPFLFLMETSVHIFTIVY